MHLVKRSGRGVDHLRQMMRKYSRKIPSTSNLPQKEEITAINISTGRLVKFAPFTRQEKVEAKKILWQQQVFAIPRCGQNKSYLFLASVANVQDVHTVQADILTQLDQITSF